MKKIIISVLFSILIILVGCNKKLDETLYDTQTLGSITTTADVLKVIQGTYGILEDVSLYKKELLKLLLLTGDDFTTTSNEYQPYSQKVYDPTSPSIAQSYQSYYSIINNCNYLLSKIPSIKTTSGTDSTLKAREEGEIRFFRAFAYFDLVRLFGEVPIRTVPTNINTNFYIARSKVDSVYALIFSDLKIAATNLPYKSTFDGIGFTNKGATQALQSLAYLTYGNYLDNNGRTAKAAFTTADSCATVVIKSGGYSLFSNYADLWNVDNESTAYGTEVIFGIRFTRDNIVSGGSALGSQLPQLFMPSNMGGVTGNPVKNALGAYGSGSGNYRVQPWFYNYCLSGDYVNDYRGDVTFITSWAKTPGSGTKYVSFPAIPSTKTDTVPFQTPYIKKYIDSKGLDAANHENDFFFLRLPEVYLIRAEAENEMYGGPSGAPNALKDINVLRKRARNANLISPRLTPLDVPSGLSQNDFRKKIFDERGLEFIGEGKRWFDLVRMKGPDGTGTMYQYQFSDYIPNQVPIGLPVYDKVAKTWSEGLIDATTVVPYDSKYLLFPIPQAERDLNSKLTQNKGWGQ